MGTAQTTIDGYSVTYNRARMTGTIDLENQDALYFAQGDVIVGVFVAKAEGPAFKEDKQGNVIRTNVARCTDLRVLSGQLKKVMVEQLGLVGMDTVELPMVKTRPKQAHETPPTPEESLPDDPIRRDAEEPDEEEFSVPSTVEVVGRIGRQESFQDLEREDSDRPRTLPFVDRDAVAGVGEREVIGRISSGDKVLQRAMQSEGWS